MATYLHRKKGLFSAMALLPGTAWDLMVKVADWLHPKCNDSCEETLFYNVRLIPMFRANPPRVGFFRNAHPTGAIRTMRAVPWARETKGWAAGGFA